MLLLADQGGQEYLRVQGLHAILPHLYLNGNRPDPAADTMVFGLAAGALYLLLALALSLRLSRREQGWSVARRVAWRVLVFVGFFACWEMSLQAWAAGHPYETYVADPVRFWSGRPDAAAPQLRVEQVDGLFDAEHPPHGSPGRMRVMVLGDSQAISTTHSRYGGAKTWPKQLQRGNVEVINAGISGYSSWQGLLLLRSLGVKYRPDLVVAAFGYHDSSMAFSPDSEVMTDDPKVHLVRSLLYRSKVYLLVRQLVLRGKAARNDRAAERARTFRVPVEEFRTVARDMAEVGRRNGFQVALMLEPFRDPNVWEHNRPYREALREVAREEGLVLLDVFGPVSRLPAAERAALFDDAIHLTDEGHREVARLVGEGLQAAGALRP